MDKLGGYGENFSSVEISRRRLKEAYGEARDSIGADAFDAAKLKFENVFNAFEVDSRTSLEDLFESMKTVLEEDDLAARSGTAYRSNQDASSEIEQQIAAIKKMHGTLPPSLPGTIESEVPRVVPEASGFAQGKLRASEEKPGSLLERLRRLGESQE